MLRQVRVEHPQYYDSIIKEELRLNKHVYVLFYGREKPETGVSYCPDCVKADPLILKALNDLDKEITLVVVLVDRKSEYLSVTNLDSPTNIYRTRDDIKLTAVPTLTAMNAESCTLVSERLVEEECFIYKDVQTFINSHY